VFYGWRTIMQQWKSAFEMSAVNRAAGHRPESYRILLGVMYEWIRDTTDYEAPLSVATVFKDPPLLERRGQNSAQVAR
jgi:hypothetical protein